MPTSGTSSSNSLSAASQAAPANQLLFRPEVTAALSSQWLGAIRLVQPLSSQIIAIVALIIAIALILFISLGEVSRKARVSGITMPVTGMLSITANSNGVLAQNHVHAGQQVSADDLLFTISSERQQADGELSSLVSQQIAQRQQSLLTEQSLRQQLAQERQSALKQRLINLAQEQQQLQHEIQLSQGRLDLAQQALLQYQALQENGFIAAAQTRQKQEDVLEIKSRIASQQRNLTQLHANKLNLEAELNSSSKQTASELEQLQRAYASQQQEQVENRNRQFIQVVAPQAGQITAINLPTGSSLQAGQSLASLIPQTSANTATPLEAHVYAPSRTAGFIRSGQTVLIRYAAFPYQKFGLHQAKVIEVSRTPFAPNELPPQLASTILSNAQQAINGFNSNEALYRIRLQLDKQDILAYGQAQSLKPGMTLEADVVQDQRKIWEWILEPALALKQKLG